MPRTTSATEVKTQLGAMIAWTIQHGDEVIIESRGKPKAVLMSYAEFEQVQRLREEARRQQALERLEALAQRTAKRNQDLTPDAAEELADRFARDVIGDMIQEGKVQYSAE